jgi:hypothetical protein
MPDEHRHSVALLLSPNSGIADQRRWLSAGGASSLLDDAFAAIRERASLNRTEQNTGADTRTGVAPRRRPR